MKTCSKCGEEKPLDGFPKRNTGAYRPWCKLCENARKREWLRKNPGKIAEYSRRHAAKHPAKVKAGRAKSNAAQRAKFKSEHGCTPSRYYRHKTSGVKELQQQGGCCVICSTALSLADSCTHIDHCHASGLVRGVLCRDCNLMLGCAKDRPAVLRAAASYLEATGVFS